MEDVAFLFKISNMRETFYSTFLRLVALFIPLSVACCCISYMHSGFRASVLPACAVKQEIFLISSVQFVSSVLKKSLLQAKPEAWKMSWCSLSDRPLVSKPRCSEMHKIHLYVLTYMMKITLFYSAYFLGYVFRNDRGKR